MAKAQYGITPAFADLLLSSLNGVRTNLQTVCAQLHDGNPGAQGIDNPSGITERQPITFTSPNSGTTNLSSAAATWDVTDGESLAAISLWSGLKTDPSAVCLFTLPLIPPVPVSEGDTVILNGCDLTWYEAYYGWWPQTQTNTPPTGQVTATGLAPTVTATPVPMGHATATGLAPTVSSSATVTAPLATVSATGLAPTVMTEESLRYVIQDQLNAAGSRAATI